MSSIIKISDHLAKEKAMAALAEMSKAWGEEIGIDEMISAFTSCERSHAKVKELMMLAHEEGLYRGYVQGTDNPPAPGEKIRGNES